MSASRSWSWIRRSRSVRGWPQTGCGGPDHDRFAPGLHHLCLRVEDNAAVDQVHGELCALGVEATKPRLYPEYASDYYATFFSDPDAIRLEITNFREERRRRTRDWESS